MPGALENCCLINLDGNKHIKFLSNMTKYQGTRGVHMIVYLKGIVYYMKNHFTSRIIFKDHEIWFNKNYNWRQKVLYCIIMLSKAIFLQ